jgi:SAM-dependent methyltransferase
MDVTNLYLYRAIPQKGKALDVGCLGFGAVKATREMGRTDIQHFGVDYGEPQEIPPGFVFRRADLNREKIPFEDDSFDFVVASHIMEHLDDAIAFFGDCLRVCKPGGRFYVETPSERSLWLPGFPFEHDKFQSLSFFDDPTHCGRPFSPQSLFRLTKYYHCEPLKADYITSWKYRLFFPLVAPLALLLKKGWLLQGITWKTFGWSAYAVVRKPEGLKGQPPFDYYYVEGDLRQDPLYRKLRWIINKLQDR